MPIRALTQSDANEYRALMLQAYEFAADAFTSTAQERAVEPLGWWVHRIADPAHLHRYRVQSQAAHATALDAELASDRLSV